MEYKWDKVGIWTYVYPETKEALERAANEKNLKPTEYIRQILVESAGINSEYLRLNRIPNSWRTEVTKRGFDNILEMVEHHVNFTIENDTFEPCDLKKDLTKTHVKELEKLERKIVLLENEVKRLKRENKELVDGKMLTRPQIFQKSLDEVLDTGKWKSLEEIATEIGAEITTEFGTPPDDARRLQLLYNSLEEIARDKGGIETREDGKWRKNPKIKPIDEVMRKIEEGLLVV